MEKFSEIFRATIAVFHGVISTWLFLEFSELSASEFEFVILVAFFTVANVVIWNLVLAAHRRLMAMRRKRKGHAAQTLSAADLETLRYRGIDVVGLFLVAVFVGLVAAYGQRKEIVLRSASLVANWNRTSSDSPFMLLLSAVTRQTVGEIDGRDNIIARAAAGNVYLRVFVKDSKIGYEGYPGVAANKRDPREIILTPACRVIFDPNDPGKVNIVQIVDGPGVFLRLADVPAIEIIDRHQSACAKAHDEAVKAASSKS